MVEWLDMPYRCLKIKNNNYYHIFNRSIAGEKIFELEKNKSAFINTFQYYKLGRYTPYSVYRRMTFDLRNSFDLQAEMNEKLVDIVAFAIMPTHYHLVLKQLKVDGIRRCVRSLEISYAKRYNLMSGRHGGVFSHRFGSVYITSQMHLYRATRYVHLNPIRSNLVTMDMLHQYPFTSFSYYQCKSPAISFKPVLKGFSDFSDYAKYVEKGIYEDPYEFAEEF